MRPAEIICQTCNEPFTEIELSDCVWLGGMRQASKTPWLDMYCLNCLRLNIYNRATGYLQVSNTDARGMRVLDLLTQPYGDIQDSQDEV